MEEQLDVDDSDIIGLFKFNAAQGRKPLIKEHNIQYDASQCSSGQLSGSFQPSTRQETLCSKQASSILNRLQRNSRFQCVEEEENEDLLCKADNRSMDLCMGGSAFRKRTCDIQTDTGNGVQGLKLGADKERSSRTCLLGTYMEEAEMGQAGNSPGDCNQDQLWTSAESQTDRILSSQVKKNIALLPFKIPGPAGIIQMSCLPKNHYLKEAFMSKPKQISLDSQAEPRDDIADFKSLSWLAALDYLHQRRSYELISTISSIKTSRIDNRIKKLLAIVRSCVPNGSGDMVVTLEDNSGLIGGVINQNVMAETEFGRDIEPGAVIILHKVAIFSPVPYAHYLNITMNNVEHVFKKQKTCEELVRD